jgi:transcription elongation factor Elf1
VAVFKKTIIKADTCVTCPICSREIIVLSAARLPRQFSVPCPNCGWRKEYRLAQLHDAKEAAETPPTIRRIQFGKKNMSV